MLRLWCINLIGETLSDLIQVPMENKKFIRMVNLTHAALSGEKRCSIRLLNEWQMNDNDESKRKFKFYLLSVLQNNMM